MMIRLKYSDNQIIIENIYLLSTWAYTKKNIITEFFDFSVKPW